MATPDVPLKGKAEDAPHTSGDVGVAVLAKRTDVAASSAGTDGDYATFNVDNTGRLWVHVNPVEPGSGAASLGKAEDAAHTSGDIGVMLLGIRNANSVVLTDAEGDYSPITVDGTGRLQIGRLIPGTLGADLGKAEDAIHASGDVGVEMLAVRQDTLAVLAANGDYIPLVVDATGRQWVNAGQNTEVTVLASAARTATPTKVDQTNLDARSLILVIDVTAIAATPSVVFTIQGKDPLSGKYYTILASAAITGVGTTVLRVDSNGTAAANLVAHDNLPRTWAVDAVHGDADSITYSVSGLLIR